MLFLLRQNDEAVPQPIRLHIHSTSFKRGQIQTKLSQE